MKKRLIIGATGASGMPILIQCLKLMKEQDDFESIFNYDRQCKVNFGT